MGVLLGIAQRERPRAVMEVRTTAVVTRESGVADDFRGKWMEGGKNKRQVSILLQDDWEAALGELGRPPIEWWQRRANLFVGGVAVPREAGTRLRVGAALFEVTVECDPCKRMDEVYPGLWPALVPDWRGGRLARVIEGGTITIGDPVNVE